MADAIKRVGLWLLGVVLLSLLATARAQNVDAVLRVTWINAGNLWLWESDRSAPRQIAAGGISRPSIAPDGAAIAFVRSSTVESLWMINADGTDERLLFDIAAQPPQANDVPRVIGAVIWVDAATLIFRVPTRPSGPGFAFGSAYTADLARGTITPLPAAAAGWLTPSPDGERLALAIPGTYGAADGVVRITDRTLETVFAEHNFAGVSTASEYPFFPQIHWVADSSAVRFALPDPDLVYEDGGESLTQLWQLAVDGTAENIGQVPASFFGQPRWSRAGAHLLYLQRTGGIGSNQLALIAADGDGANPQTVTTSDTFAIARFGWAGDRTQFVYEQGAPGTYWIAAPDAAPRRLPSETERMALPLFPGDDWLVFETYPIWNGGASDTTELRTLRLDQPDTETILIAIVPAALTSADTVLIRQP